MAFFDKLKEVKDNAVASANNAAQKAKEQYEASKQAREEKKAAGTESLEGKYLCQVSGSLDMNFKIGQLVLFYGKHTSWEEPGNPGQFDAGKYYCSQGILGQFKKCNYRKNESVRQNTA